jgi:phosphoserine phosphatase RsbU/P
VFIPCDHCLRKNATHVSEVDDRGEPANLRLCGECYRKLKQDLAHRPAQFLNQKMTVGQNEQMIAAEMQFNLFPRRVPQIPGYDFSAWFRPSADVGGDYYDMVEIDDDHLGLLVADVSTKGIQGMIAMTETRALLRGEALRTADPIETLTRVNRVLHKDIQVGVFVTMYYAVLDIPQATLTCVSAGHNPMVFWRKASQACNLINPNGLALGIDRGPLFEKTIAQRKIPLAAGDRFTFYTDGILSATNDKKEEFGRRRLCLKSEQHPDLASEEFLKHLIREVERHCGHAPQHDDMAVVTGRFKGDA